MQQPLAYIPSPSQNSIHLGPIPLRGYALMIILGVIVAVWLSERRWAARGGTPGTVVDVAVWAVPFGLVGGRLYHVITDHQLYFGHGRHPIDALKVWNGGLGIWGAIALGALGAYLGARRRGVSMRAFADAAAPGIVLAQAVGRWGNWFNQELYGRPTKVPWAVKIDPAHRPAATPDIGTYHPTFLYESLWCIGVALLVIWAEKRFRLAYGRTFALYVAAYTVGRAWIEWLRVDPAHHVLGLRLNDWTSLIVFLAAVAYLFAYRSRTENPPGAFGPAGDTTAPAAEATGEEQPGEQDAAAGPQTAEDPAGTPEPSGADAAAPDEQDADADDGGSTATAAGTADEAGEAADDATQAGDATEADAPDDGADGASDDAADGAAVDEAGSDAGKPAGDAAVPGGAAPAEAETATPDDDAAGAASPDAEVPPAEQAGTVNGIRAEGDAGAGKVGADRKETAAAGGEPADA